MKEGAGVMPLTLEGVESAQIAVKSMQIPAKGEMNAT
jgi:hypothetical protein